MPFLFQLLVLLVCIGFCIWLLSFLPVPEPYKTLIRGIILFAVILFILYAAFAYMPNFSFPVQRRY